MEKHVLVKRQEAVRPHHHSLFRLNVGENLLVQVPHPASKAMPVPVEGRQSWKRHQRLLNLAWLLISRYQSTDLLPHEVFLVPCRIHVRDPSPRVFSWHVEGDSFIVGRVEQHLYSSSFINTNEHCITSVEGTSIAETKIYNYH